MYRALLDKYFIKKPKLRLRVTKLLYGNEDCNTNLFGMEYKINTLRENGYLRGSRKAKMSHLLEHDGSILSSLILVGSRCSEFVDIGANIGLYAKQMCRARFLSPELRIIAFEPHPDTFIRTQANLRGVTEEVYRKAISATNEHRLFIDGAVSHVFVDAKYRNKYSIDSHTFGVECIRLADAGLNLSNALLKIDVEGAEFDVLRGAESLIKDNKINAVYIDGYSPDKGLPEFLESYGFIFLDPIQLTRVTKPGWMLLAARAPVLLGDRMS